VLYFCAKHLCAQDVSIYVYDSGSKIVKNAMVKLNDEILPYDSLYHKYIKHDANIKNTEIVELTIECVGYKTSTKKYNVKDFFKTKGELIKYTYLFKSTDEYYMSGRDSIPFEKNLKYLGLELQYKTDSSKIKLNKILKELRLEIVENTDYRFTVIKKKNGKEFDDGNCNELKLLRKNHLFRAVGPIVCSGILLPVVYFEFDEKYLNEIISEGKKNWLTFEEFYYSLKMYKFCTKPEISFEFISHINNMMKDKRITSCIISIYHKPELY